MLKHPNKGNYQNPTFSIKSRTSLNPIDLIEMLDRGLPSILVKSKVDLIVVINQVMQIKEKLELCMS